MKIDNLTDYARSDLLRKINELEDEKQLLEELLDSSKDDVDLLLKSDKEMEAFTNQTKELLRASRSTIFWYKFTWSAFYLCSALILLDVIARFKK